MPKISIIIPVYNIEQYLEECLKSILEQRVDCFEVILVDDGSTDQSPAICDSYAENYEMVRVLHQPNQGVSVARNNGLKLADGDYIWFVDGDDLLYPQALHKVYHQINNQPNIDVIAGTFVKFYDKPINPCEKSLDPSLIAQINSSSGEQICCKLIQTGLFLPSMWANIFAKSLFLTHQIQFQNGVTNNEDIDCAMRLYLHVQKIFFLDTPIYCYRQARKGSASSSFSVKRLQCSLGFIQNWLSYINSLPKSDLKDFLTDYIAYQYSIALGSVQLCNKTDRKKLLFMLKPYRRLLKSGMTVKTKKVKMLYSCLGYRLTSFTLGLFIKLKSKNKN